MKIYLDHCTYNRPFDERFITSIKNNNFDYTEWHKNLWKDKSINEIHNMATEFEKEKFNGLV
jgi:hypothetical protein